MAEMQPTMEILERIKKNSKENKDEVFTRLYRYMILLTIAFLISPMGLPMFAVWVLSALQSVSHFFKSI